MFENPLKTKIKRERISVKGIVQGVGFRPFVFNLAKSLNLTGYVSNTREGVIIEIEGKEIELFIELLQKEAPPLSEIDSIKREEIDILNSDDFIIKHSEGLLGNETLISPDVSICDDCLEELFDVNNRRYLYPFINCTNCGPRFTIIENIPYDRPYTTMKKFILCRECEEEYNNPTDRRFHAQPNACPRCGPEVWVEISTEKIEGNESVFDFTVRKLIEGKIIAIKGLGGFHLACLASNEEAIKTLRVRKHRPTKPLAIMLPSIEETEKIGYLTDDEKNILCSKERPILLLKSKNRLPHLIAPNNNRIGVMLPYTPLHYILFHYLRKYLREEAIPALVMTSANLSEEPICITNEDAKERLKDIADIFLFHNRDILIRSDDSVGAYINNKFRLYRRSRGYVPKRVKLLNSTPSILALGGELKNTVCITKEDNAFISQHIGDVTNLRAYNFFEETIEHLQKIMNCKAEILVQDLHPDYKSSQWAEKSGMNIIKVQHHHAHLASCMIENKIDEEVIGVILDGTGLGYDSTIWGGEILFGNYTQFERVFRLEEMPLPGGDSAAKEPWRTAVSYLYSSVDNLEIPDYLKEFRYKDIIRMIDAKINSPLTSSMGRLFDAVTAIAGGPTINNFEAEAAIHLMNAAAVESSNDKYEFDSINITERKIKIKELIRNIYLDVKKKENYPVIAAKFHNTLSDIIVRTVSVTANWKNTDKVCLSGGVFQNELLLTGLEKKLTESGFQVFTQSVIPVNDGGLSLGQAAIASRLISENKTNVKFIN